MAQPIVLVTFYSRWGWTEKLALAAGVGAVQSRALIRLRRVPDIDPPEGNATILRMQKEYVEPREADIVAANALILAAPAGFTTSAPEWKSFVEVLHALGVGRRLEGKVAAIVDTANETTQSSFNEMIRRLGFHTLQPILDQPGEIERATALGRSVGALARSMFA
jgi:multimeric flavodoxin WrbA